MKIISILLSILIILSIWTPFALGKEPTTISGSRAQEGALVTKIPTTDSSTGSKTISGSRAQEGALVTKIPTPVSGSDSSLPLGGPGSAGSEQGQMGSSIDQMGSDHQQQGSSIWEIPIATYPSLVTTHPSSYQISESNNLWIESPQGRVQYANVPQYSHVSLTASTSSGGQGAVYELYPITMNKGAYTTTSYNFASGDNQLAFAADIVGRHIVVFSINNQFSNVVAIDVQSQQNNGGMLGQGVPSY